MLYPEDYKIIGQRLTTFGFQTYTQYIGSGEWKRNRERFPKTKCYCCKKKKKLMNLHHMTYERLCEEYSCDVCWVCRDCHKQIHFTYMSFSGKRKWTIDLLGFATEYYRLTFLEENPVQKRKGEIPAGIYKKKVAGQGVVKPLERSLGKSNNLHGYTITVVSRPKRYKPLPPQLIPLTCYNQ